MLSQLLSSFQAIYHPTMDTEEPRDAGRMVTDESPVASTSTSSADATAPAERPVEQSTSLDAQASTSNTTLEETESSPAAKSEGAVTVPAAESSAATTSAPAKTDPEIRVWKPVTPGTMPKPRKYPYCNVGRGCAYTLMNLHLHAYLAATLAAELPESYYTPTPGQLRAAYAGQSNQLKKMGVDVNFSSKAQRDKEERERQQQRASRWPKVSGARTLIIKSSVVLQALALIYYMLFLRLSFAYASMTDIR